MKKVRVYERVGNEVILFGKWHFASDKVDHFTFMGIGASGIVMGFCMQIMWYTFPNANLFWMKVIGVFIGAVIATGIGIGIEYWQKYKNVGVFDWKDVYAQMYGEIIPAMAFIILSQPITTHTLL